MTIVSSGHFATPSGSFRTVDTYFPAIWDVMKLPPFFDRFQIPQKNIIFLSPCGLTHLINSFVNNIFLIIVREVPKKFKQLPSGRACQLLHFLYATVLQSNVRIEIEITLCGFTSNSTHCLYSSKTCSLR